MGKEKRAKTEKSGRAGSVERMWTVVPPQGTEREKAAGK
jgi:hypothetical protein